MIIRTLREDRGWSQEQLAEMSGVSVRTIQRIESGGRASLETLKCLAAVFETTIPDLRKDSTMAEHDKPVEQPEPPREEAAKTPDGLSAEDRAALRYVRYLKRYDDWYDEDEDEYDDEYDDGGGIFDRRAGRRDGGDGRDLAGLPSEERRVRRQVRRERQFFRNLLSYVVIIGFLAFVNLMTSPGYLWFLWAAGGWGIGVAFHAMDVFGRNRFLGEDWERQEVEKRLRRLSRRTERG